MPIVAPPETEAVLLGRCREIAGRNLQELSLRCGRRLPPDLLHHKGWVGDLVEQLLGADAGSLATPDFTALNIELKTIPVDAKGIPRESTYVTVAPMLPELGCTWKNSPVLKKLARVLWVPIQAEPDLPLAARCVGQAFLWAPTAEDERLLQADWEEHLENIALGRAGSTHANCGEVLQIRPKARNARVRKTGIGPEGNRTEQHPLGFYLRPSFTAKLLRENYSILQSLT